MRGTTGTFSELSKFIAANPAAKLGCLMDTSILFSASYDLDLFNADAAQAVDALADLGVPIYTTHNVRSEFLELHRRIIIPECLVDMMEDVKDLRPELVAKLTSMRTQMRKATSEGKAYKLSEQQIKYFRAELATYQLGEQDGWEAFCQNYLSGKIERVWDTAVEQLGLNFIGLRAEEDSAVLSGQPGWKGTTALVGRFGIGSVDALILDLFFNSKLTFLITSDRDMAYCVARAKQPDRFVFLPDGIELD